MSSSLSLNDTAKITLFSKLSNFQFDLRPSQARQRSEIPTPGAPRICEFPGAAKGESMVRLGFD